MKKLITVLSLFALVLASSGLFAVDIPVGDGGGKFSLGIQAEYEFDIITDDSQVHDNDKTWIEELDADKQAKVSISASYDGDNYAFGVGAGFRQSGLDASIELKLKGLAANNGKSIIDEDEGEGDFTGMNFHFVVKYTFAPVTFRLSIPVTGFADGRENAPDPVTRLAVQVTVDIPNAEGSRFDLGDPWVRFKMLPNAILDDAGKTESFKDILIDFEWEPSFSIVQDQFKAYVQIGAYYRAWANARDDDLEKKYPLTIALRPKLEFKFAPSATLAIQDKISFIRQATEKGVKNEFGFRFAWAF